jgi:hypothetical protein
VNRALYKLFVFLVFTSTACENESESYTISGYASYGRAPVQENPITLEGAISAVATTSLHEGFFEFKNVPAGTYTLTIQVGSNTDRFSRVVRTITVGGDVYLDQIIVPYISFFYKPTVTTDGVSNHITLTWEYGYPTDDFESYELRRYSAPHISETTGEVIAVKNSVSDTTYSTTIPANEPAHFAVFVRGTDFIACSGVQSPFRYDLYLYDKFDSRPLAGINIARHKSDPFGPFESPLGETDANGNFSLTSLIAADKYYIFTHGAKGLQIVGPTYSEPYDETVYPKNKITKAYLTTYSPLKLEALKNGSYSDTDSLFVEVGPYKKKYKCNDVPEEILNDTSAKLLSHQNHSIKWVIKTASGSSAFEHTIFCEPMKSYSYKIEF